MKFVNQCYSSAIVGLQITETYLTSVFNIIILTPVYLV